LGIVPVGRDRQRLSYLWLAAKSSHPFSGRRGDDGSFFFYRQLVLDVSGLCIGNSFCLVADKTGLLKFLQPAKK